MNQFLKNTFPYLTVLIPLVIIGLIQKTDIYQSSTNQDGRVTRLPVDVNEIVLSGASKSYQRLTNARLIKEIKSITTSQSAEQFLSRYLMMAKDNANSRYAGFAIAGYDLLPTNIKHSPSVQLRYADVLSYSHLFNKALKVLEELQWDKQSGQQAILNSINIYMLKGDLKSVETWCQKTIQFDDYRVSLACRFWLTGIQSAKISKIKQSILQLDTLASKQVDTDSFDRWLLQLSIDLNLKMGDTDNAIKKLKRLLDGSQNDLAALIQVFDYLLLDGRGIEAENLLFKYDPSQSLVVRQAIVHQVLAIPRSDNLFRQIDKDTQVKPVDELISNYINIAESSKFKEVALWLFFKYDDLNQAEQYAKKNLSSYKNQNDFMLLSFVRDAIDEKSAGGTSK